MIKAYFFDWMGTLADATERFSIREKFGADIHHLLLVKQLEDTNISKKEKSVIDNELNNSTHWLYNDSQEITEKLCSNYKLAIISNMYGITAKRIKKLFPSFLNQFDVLTFSAEAGLKKPDPKIFIHTLEKLNKLNGSKILPKEVMMIGDKQDKDMEPTLALGMQAKLIDRSKQNLRDII